jgi:hypothetical protein
MQRLEFSGAVRPIKGSLGVKGLSIQMPCTVRCSQKRQCCQLIEISYNKNNIMTINIVITATRMTNIEDTSGES